ncbi:hypothetical protein BX600DRAFT_444534 [Xylariales sp. PMI_506]|nr:hypothetical protein BX600DRAFT_444534 [Xylariales sp. PMI_506]
MGWDIKQNGISTNHKVPYKEIAGCKKPVKRRILVRRRRAGRRNNTLEGDITAVKAQEAYLEDLKNRYYAHNGITKRRPENEGPIESFFLRSRHKLDYSTVVESQARRAYKLQ